MSVTGLAGMLNIKGLSPEVIPPVEIFAGTPASFTLRLSNTKRLLPSFLLTLECRDAKMTPGKVSYAAGFGGSAIFPFVSRSGAVSATLPLTFGKRGRASVERITASSPFPVNFFVRWWTYGGSGDFIVFPRLLPCRLGEGEGNGGRWGAAPLRSKGLDGELERIGEYTGNEPMRMIHWKATARSGELMIKEFGSQAVRPLLIDVESLPGADMEERISRAAWLIRRWVEERPVGLTLGCVTVPSGTGRQHGSRLLTELALWETGVT